MREWGNSIDSRVMSLETKVHDLQTEMETLKILLGECQMLIMKIAENQKILSQKYGTWPYVLLKDD